MRLRLLCEMVFSSALTLATFALVVSGCMFQFMGPLFLYFFQASNLLSLDLQFRIILGFTFGV